MRFFADGRQSGVNKRPRGVRVQLCGRCGPAGQSEDGGDGARPLRPAGGYARLACASPDRGLRTSVGLSSRKGKQKFAARWEKDQICSRTTMVLGQGGGGGGGPARRGRPGRRRGLPRTRPFKPCFLRKRQNALPPIGGRMRRRICSRATTALGQGAVCPSIGRAFNTRPFKSFFLRKRKYTLPPIGGRVYFGCGRRI